MNHCTLQLQSCVRCDTSDLSLRLLLPSLLFAGCMAGEDMRPAARLFVPTGRGHEVVTTTAPSGSGDYDIKMRSLQGPINGVEELYVGGTGGTVSAEPTAVAVTTTTTTSSSPSSAVSAAVDKQTAALSGGGSAAAEQQGMEAASSAPDAMEISPTAAAAGGREVPDAAVEGDLAHAQPKASGAAAANSDEVPAAVPRGEVDLLAEGETGLEGEGGRDTAAAAAAAAKKGNAEDALSAGSGEYVGEDVGWDTEEGPEAGRVTKEEEQGKVLSSGSQFAEATRPAAARIAEDTSATFTKPTEEIVPAADSPIKPGYGSPPAAAAPAMTRRPSLWAAATGFPRNLLTAGYNTAASGFNLASRARQSTTAAAGKGVSAAFDIPLKAAAAARTMSGQLYDSAFSNTATTPNSSSRLSKSTAEGGAADTAAPGSGTPFAAHTAAAGPGRGVRGAPASTAISRAVESSKKAAATAGAASRGLGNAAGSALSSAAEETRRVAAAAGTAGREVTGAAGTAVTGAVQGTRKVAATAGSSVTAAATAAVRLVLASVLSMVRATAAACSRAVASARYILAYSLQLVWNMYASAWQLLQPYLAGVQAVALWMVSTAKAVAYDVTHFATALIWRGYQTVGGFRGVVFRGFELGFNLAGDFVRAVVAAASDTAVAAAENALPPEGFLALVKSWVRDQDLAVAAAAAQTLKGVEGGVLGDVVAEWGESPAPKGRELFMQALKVAEEKGLASREGRTVPATAAPAASGGAAAAPAPAAGGAAAAAPADGATGGATGGGGEASSSRGVGVQGLAGVGGVSLTSSGGAEWGSSSDSEEEGGEGAGEGLEGDVKKMVEKRFGGPRRHKQEFLRSLEMATGRGLAGRKEKMGEGGEGRPGAPAAKAAAEEAQLSAAPAPAAAGGGGGYDVSSDKVEGTTVKPLQEGGMVAGGSGDDMVSKGVSMGSDVPGGEGEEEQWQQQLRQEQQVEEDKQTRYELQQQLEEQEGVGQEEGEREAPRKQRKQEAETARAGGLHRGKQQYQEEGADEEQQQQQQEQALSVDEGSVQPPAAALTSDAVAAAALDDVSSAGGAAVTDSNMAESGLVVNDGTAGAGGGELGGAGTGKGAAAAEAQTAAAKVAEEAVTHVIEKQQQQQQQQEEEEDTTAAATGGLVVNEGTAGIVAGNTSGSNAPLPPTSAATAKAGGGPAGSAAGVLLPEAAVEAIATGLNAEVMEEQLEVKEGQVEVGELPGEEDKIREGLAGGKAGGGSAGASGGGGPSSGGGMGPGDDRGVVEGRPVKQQEVGGEGVERGASDAVSNVSVVNEPAAAGGAGAGNLNRYGSGGKNKRKGKRK